MFLMSTSSICGAEFHPGDGDGCIRHAEHIGAHVDRQGWAWGTPEVDNVYDSDDGDVLIVADLDDEERARLTEDAGAAPDPSLLTERGRPNFAAIAGALRAEAGGMLPSSLCATELRRLADSVEDVGKRMGYLG